MELAGDIARIDEQERRLLFAHFDGDSAWRLGLLLRELAIQCELPLAIEIRLARQTVFFHAMAGMSSARADEARRKRNTVELLHRSSYGIGRSLARQGTTLGESLGLPSCDYASLGGSFPLMVEGLGCVGAVTVSGACERDEHEIVVMALAESCGVALGDIVLD